MSAERCKEIHGWSQFSRIFELDVFDFGCSEKYLSLVLTWVKEDWPVWSWNKIKLFGCIDDIEKLIDTSELLSNEVVLMSERQTPANLYILGHKHPKSKKLFLKTNRQVERFSETLFTFMMKILLPCAMLPQCIVCFAIYFTTDSGSDSFQLPFTMW